MNRIARIAGGIAALAVVGGYWAYQTFLTVDLPVYPAVEAGHAQWLDQQWSPKQRSWYHNADQGTATFGIPYEWFVALEGPSLSLFGKTRLADPQFLNRIGFIPPSDVTPGELPVGFSRGGPMNKPDNTPWQNPATQQSFTAIGLTCAACHTGRLTYQGHEIYVDGGPAMTNLADLRKALYLSMLFTKYDPLRFGRFADRVLGSHASDDARTKLKADFEDIWGKINTVKKLDDSVADGTVEEGYGRLDALNRIGNTVFSVDLGFVKANYAPYAAPVHFPRIWDASWFTWVQYDGSIEQPMVRNAGEALGVSAPVSLLRQPLFESGVKVENLVQMEEMLAGQQPTDAKGFSGLSSPKWPAGILPPINTGLAAQGAALYETHCQSCHLPPVGSPAFWKSDRWTPPNAAGQRYIDLHLVPISRVGTDEGQAVGLANRKVTVPADLRLSDTGETTLPFGTALGTLVEKTVNYWYTENKISPADQDRMNGYRRNGIQAPPAYQAHPLNGIWATPPYLHNASVPTLYALLSPVEERPAVFWLGNREYDPVNVGYRTEKLAGGFELDTTKVGNANKGHEFSDIKRPGVIGPLLKPEERLALVEFLKTQ